MYFDLLLISVIGAGACGEARCGATGCANVLYEKMLIFEWMKCLHCNWHLRVKFESSPPSLSNWQVCTRGIGVRHAATFFWVADQELKSSYHNMGISEIIGSPHYSIFFEFLSSNLVFLAGVLGEGDAHGGLPRHACSPSWSCVICCGRQSFCPLIVLIRLQAYCSLCHHQIIVPACRSTADGRVIAAMAWKVLDTDYNTILSCAS